MIKNFLICGICLISLGTYAQNGTVSPYSFFGIGDSRTSGTVENQSMGGLQMFADSIHVNLSNPAAYSELLLTTYTGGISSTTLRLKENVAEESVSVANLDYIAIGLPIAKNTGIGFGLRPFSSVGYSFTDFGVNAAQDSTSTSFTGEGGINTAFLSIGFKPVKNLSVGATVNYNFGTIENQNILVTENVPFPIFRNRESRINGYDFNFAANYRKKINDKYDFLAHVAVDTQINFVSENSEEIGTLNPNVATTDANFIVETVDTDLDALNLKNTELKVPTTTTFGLGIGKKTKWFLGAEYSFQQLSSFENTFARLDNVVYDDAQSVRMGGFYVPDSNSFSSFFKRITYRAGFFYNESGLVVNEREINDFGITFGFGIPLGNNFSNINLGFELGRRGTMASGLVEENRFKVNLGISLNDKWFRKRKIN